MLVLVAVADELRAVLVPLKMCLHLITAVFEIGVEREVVPAVVFYRSDALDLSLNGVHHSDLVDIPDDSGLPVDRVKNTLESFVCRDLIACFFSANAHYRVGEKRVVSEYFKCHYIRMFHMLHTSCVYL